MKIAFFDFDGTIIKGDSLISFIRYAVGGNSLILGLIWLFPTLIGYKIGVIPNYIAKQRLLAHFFAGYREDKFLQLAQDFSLQYIDKMLRPKAIKRIEWHKKQGHQIVVVSASIESWIEPWCKKNSLDLIATQLEFKSGIVSGSFQTKNCYGKEKLRRIKNSYNIDDYEYIYAYGDSKGDKELLEFAHESGFKVF